MKSRPPPISAAERMRQYRERKGIRTVQLDGVTMAIAEKLMDVYDVGTLQAAITRAIVDAADRAGESFVPG